MKKRFLLFIVPSLLLISLVIAQTGSAQGEDAYDLIDTVNQLRAANGLPAYQINAALMGSAQGHSEYQSTLGTWTHTGADGSNETQRAYAAGYGGGAKIHCDEAVAITYGYNAYDVVYDLWQDYDHLQIMLSAEYKEVGGGLAEAGGRYYYTIDACVVVGGTYTSPTNSGNPGSQAPQPTQPPILPATVTPQEDGSIIHTVREGEVLITIAQAYNIPLKDLLELNSLTTTSVIYVGDKLKIRLAPTITPTSEITNTPTPRPVTPTRRPTRTATSAPPTATIVSSPAPSATPTPPPSSGVDTVGKVITGVIIVLGIAGVILVVAGTVMRKKD
jgi:LysM repeat protein